MRVLVTGGAGFIGSHIVTALRTAGHEPVVLDALLPSAHPTAPERPDAEFVRADVRDAPAVRAALIGIDAVCHQAAMVGLGKDFADAPEYVSCNDLGTAVLLASMAQTGVRRLVLTHFSERYPAADEHRFADEASAAFGGDITLVHDLDRIPLPPRRLT